MARTSDKDAYRRAVDKATKDPHRPPKEKHVLTLFSAKSAQQCKSVREILERRLALAHSWQIALNTLSLIHRIITAAHPDFTIDLNILLNSSDFQNITTFTDKSNKHAAQSVRNYALYLQARLKYHLVSRSTGSLKSKDLLQQVGALQALLTLLFDCIPPNGNLVQNPLVQYAVELLLRDCGTIYSEISDYISKIVELFFEMPGGQNVVALDIYKSHLQQISVLREMQRFVSPYTNVELPVPPMALGSSSMVEIMEEHINRKKEIEANATVWQSKSASFRRPRPLDN
ncbi:hypothetical protein SUGI_0609670 [Cryptomeria japonica]|nr:hypothetical protein SUGI_0609670 [Cryptomeria japonica]